MHSTPLAFGVVLVRFLLQNKVMKKTRASKIYTIGHSNKSFATFLDTLKRHKIEVLVDVRSFPQSRFCPHFNLNALQSELPTRTIKYLYRGKNLGGRGVNEGYDDAIKELATMAKKGTRVCVMCSEGDYHKCHRLTTLTPSFEERGLEVSHIEYENETTKRNR